MRFSAFIIASLSMSGALFANMNPAPIDINVAADEIRPAHMHRRHKSDHQKFHYREERALALYTYAFDKDDFFRIGGGVKNYLMKFEKVHPHIHQKEFNNFVVNLAGEKSHVWHDNLKVRTDIYVHNNTERTKFKNTFVIYEAESVYQANPNANIHLGVVGTAGLHFTRYLPMIGFDFSKNSWKINAVFPTNVSLVYAFNKAWSINTAVRWFLSRQRLGKTEHRHLKEGLVTYLNGGAEVGVNYIMMEGLAELCIHAGETFGGRARTGDERNNHRQTYRVKPAPYFGASLNIAL
jgi:hypothetical protein